MKMPHPVPPDSAPVPPGRWSVQMSWHNLLFAHWAVDADAIQKSLPEGLTVDTYEGKAYVGLVPFTMTNVRHRYSPPIPTLHAFHECNVRTYVTLRDHPDEGGVFFYSLDAASRMAVWGTRTFWNLPYFNAAIDLQRTGDETTYAVDRTDPPRAKMSCTWTKGAQLDPVEPGSLRWFLSERYQLFTARRGGGVLGSSIWHERWPLHAARLEELDDELIEAAGFPSVEGPPHTPCFHAERLDVWAWPLRRVG